jgi:DNA polymerase-3 subunit delta'
MSWNDIYEHQPNIEAFRRAAARGRLASTFLFVGPPGVGKRTFAVKLAQALLCETNAEALLDPCGDCWSCLHLAAGTHPDLEQVGKPDDKAFIPLETFIGDAEHRNREGLCHRIAIKPMRGRRKIAIIDDADYLNAEGANSLLKTLEEPPPRSVIILIGTSALRQLPTIRSRCQIVRFAPLASETVEQLLVEKRLVEDRNEAAQLALLSEGSVARALELADPELRQFRASFLTSLGELPFDSYGLAKSVAPFVDAAGKEAPPRRLRLKQVIGWGADYFRQAMWQGSGAEFDSPAATTTQVAIAPEMAAECLELCLDAVQQVDANANLTTLVDAWLSQIGRRLN